MHTELQIGTFWARSTSALLVVRPSWLAHTTWSAPKYSAFSSAFSCAQAGTARTPSGRAHYRDAGPEQVCRPAVQNHHATACETCKHGWWQTLFRACVCSGCDSTNFGWSRSGVTFSSGCNVEQGMHSDGLQSPAWSLIGVFASRESSRLSRITATAQSIECQP